MVDAERLRRILQGVADDLAILREYADQEEQTLLEDQKALGHIKYLFVTAIGRCADAAHHVCASEGWGPPESSASAMDVLARHGALPEGLRLPMRATVGFRNVLVHEYAEVDDSRVTAALRDLHDLERFIAAIAPLAK